MKLMSVWGGRIAWFLIVALNLALPIQNILESTDPVREALGYLAVAALIIGVAVIIQQAFRLLQARMAPVTFRILNVTLAAIALFVLIVVWSAMTRFAPDGTALGGSWGAIGAVFQSEDPIRVLAELSAAPAATYGVVGILTLIGWIFEKTLRGNALLAGRLALAAVVAFIVIVVLPASLHRPPGQPLVDQSLVTSLLLWLGMVVPAIGVIIVYRTIGDGRA